MTIKSARVRTKMARCWGDVLREVGKYAEALTSRRACERLVKGHTCLDLDLAWGDIFVPGSQLRLNEHIGRFYSSDE
jgi:hypothetical protein